MTADDITSRLASLFATVLKLPHEAIIDTLSPESCETWDSLNHIHLVNGVEEMFGVMLEFDEQMNMDSFAHAREIVSAALARR